MVVAERPDLSPAQLAEACAGFVNRRSGAQTAAELVDLIAAACADFEPGTPVAAVWSQRWGWHFVEDVRPRLRREIAAEDPRFIF